MGRVKIRLAVKSNGQERDREIKKKREREILTNREELSFRTVLAFPKAARG